MTWRHLLLWLGCKDGPPAYDKCIPYDAFSITNAQQQRIRKVQTKTTGDSFFVNRMLQGVEAFIYVHLQEIYLGLESASET